MEALYKAPHRVPAIFPIASTHASAKYTPYINISKHRQAERQGGGAGSLVFSYI